MKKLLKYLLTAAPFLYMILIWIMSSNPDDAVIRFPDDGVDRFIKESLHLVEFGILYGLFVVALLAHGRLRFTLNFMVALIAIFYGFIDEIHQSFVPYRSSTMIDAAKDLIGVTVLFWIVNRTYFRNPDHRLTKAMQKFENYVKKD
ncbi:VanZ family protein [Rossellomorea vietnamensis]|uniref:VanZ family protein n=1 Tax=Rossellomorea vietnamensis TaxID=218284 RepID=A0A0P6WT57_9BACI|nr:VanZ family protein [Rossellomorea vietnamensis]KPL59349.1 VanZ family protein [Rossellomorea vietnamensis]